jgi:hypothetical protein
VYHERHYFLCEFLAYFSIDANQEFQGFYKPDGTPVFPDGMAISAHNPTNARKQRVRTPSLVILEFTLSQLPHIGTAGQLLHLSLAQNYLVVPERLHHEPVFFDISSADELAKHAAMVSKLVKELQKRYAILV